ncbi:MAG: hypothetical protein FD147_2578, partial [Chloroflexi bacterium]
KVALRQVRFGYVGFGFDALPRIHLLQPKQEVFQQFIKLNEQDGRDVKLIGGIALSLFPF